MNQTTKSHWLAALHCNGMGPQTFRRLISEFENIESVFAASISDLKNSRLDDEEIQMIKNPNWKIVEEDLTWCEKENCHIITSEDSNYPKRLQEIHAAPLVLFVRGDPAILSEPQLAIVGSRNPTTSGNETAEQFAYTLSQYGFTITSGMALGIDTAAHRGALKTGKTIAVMGTGLKHIYPKSNTKLAEEIINNGALISEFPPDTEAKKTHFPQRNRLISGLSIGVLVVEAALRSGSLITTRFAIEQGREVFAIPGSIHNPLARGCHFLIRQGAKLVETAEDILEECRAITMHFRQNTLPIKENNPLKKASEKAHKILKTIDYAPTSLDKIIARCGLTSSEVSSMLLSLELEGYIKSAPGGFVKEPLK